MSIGFPNREDHFAFATEFTEWEEDSDEMDETEEPVEPEIPVRENHRPIPFLTPLSSVLAGRGTMERGVNKGSAVVSSLPGFGITDPNDRKSSVFTATSAIQPQNEYFGGSLELTSNSQRLVPAIYIDGKGYVPTSHPSLSPFLDSDRDRPETNPYIVMVPENRLAGYDTTTNPMDEYSSPFPESTRMIDTNGRTKLSWPKQDDLEPIVVSAKTGWSKRTKEFDIFFLEGDCSVRQGNDCVSGPNAVVWVTRPKSGNAAREVTVYLESDSEEIPLRLVIDPENVEATIHDRKWFGRFNTRTSVETLVMSPLRPVPKQEPAIYRRALAMMSPDYSVIRQAQYVASSPTTPDVRSTPPKYRKISLTSRGDNLMDIRFDPYPQNPERGVLVISKGLNLVIEGVAGNDMLLGDTVDISADHAVIWAQNPKKIRRNSETQEDSNLDFEVYLEGNIIFRDGARKIEANRMYYDAKNEVAYILDGRLSMPLTGVSNFSGSIRLKAEILQQLGDGIFTAKNTLVTTSQLGEPSYSLRSRSMTLTERLGTTVWGDEPKVQQILVAENNYIAARNVPVFYWPWIAADVKDPTFYIKNFAYANNKDFGNQIKTKWNPFQILNIRNRPDWFNGDVSVSWLERRGISHGAGFGYEPTSFCWIPGQTDGDIYFWGIYDKGKTDNLGGSRKKVPFPDRYRYRFYWTHEQKIPSLWKWAGPWDLTASVGKVSDRNLTNYYFNGEWNRRDNASTGVSLKKTDGNSSVSIFTEYALDDFYTNSNWLPRLDHFLIGQSLLNDRLTWYEHTRVGYVDYNTATSPYAPDRTAWNQDARYFRYLPWELTTDSPTSAPPRPDLSDAEQPKTINSSFEVFSTRHEIDLPFNAGPVRCVPYILGDFSHWGQDRSGKDVQRLYGQAGVRLNLPFWKVMANRSNRTWYVNGLAHKVDFDTEFSYARSDRDMENLILTDSLDNWSVEDFRRRYSASTFAVGNSVIPWEFDPRSYALRSGMGGNVAASNMEIADDLTMLRVGMTHRFQTKRGPVGRRRIIDWITMAVHFNYYPEKKQNMNESIGLIDYNFLWHVGDRFSLFSSGLYDTFKDGQRITSVGGLWGRPNRGNFNFVVDRLDGYINRTYLTTGVSYKMNEKYAMSYSTSYDITKSWKNKGHKFIFTRTGESFRIMIGATYNEARDDWSISFGLEPVFMSGIMSRMRKTANAVQKDMDR